MWIWSLGQEDPLEINPLQYSCLGNPMNRRDESMGSQELDITLVTKLPQHYGEPCYSSARYCNLAGTVTECSKDHYTIWSGQLLHHGEKYGKTNTFHQHGPTDCPSFAAKWLLWSETMLCGILWWWISHSLRLWMVVLEEALSAEEANLYPVSIPRSIKHCLLHNRSGPM